MALDSTARDWLRQTFGDRVRFQEPMARHTYFRVGGPADALVTPDSPAELVRLAAWLKENGIPYLVIGGGTNLLVKDGGIRGAVIATGQCLTRLSHEAASGGDALLTSGAGLKLQHLCRYAIEHGLQGMTFATGIPGTVGGSIAMNAGTRYGCIGDVLHALTVLDAETGEKKLPRAQLKFSYRSLNWEGLLQDARDAQPIIMEAEFMLRASDREALRKETDRIAAQRRSSQPSQEPSAGCFFRNPASGQSAGQLIDMAGLKGRRIGGAEVSVRHANFIVNKGNATAADILALKDLIQDTVFTQFQIKLETEVKIVGSSA